MTEWTDSAERELELYFASIRGGLAAAGAEPAEVLEDIRRHVEEEAAAGGLATLTAGDVEAILARMGPPARLGEEAAGAARPAERGPKPTPPGLEPTAGVPISVFVGLFGVLLPVIAIAVELGTRVCAETFFDPLPDVWHVLLYGLIPAANLAVLVAAVRGSARGLAALGWANGAALGVSIFFALCFLPIVPVAIVGILVMGLGLLGLSPLFAVLTTGLCRRQLNLLSRQLGRARAPGLWGGLGVAAAALAGLIVPRVLTLAGLEMACSESPARSRRGVRLLRTIGSEEEMLRACYVRPRRATDLTALLFNLGEAASPEQARAAYYRATGSPFNSVPPPPGLPGRGIWDPAGEIDADFEQGGEAVGGRVKGLALAGSRMDGLIDADAAVAYVEWTLVFRNDHGEAREARAQIALPSGGAVSRLTLWIDGQEREAAFNSRGRTRAAYQEVAVRQRRDPVLVTTAGPGRVLVQCFPVPPRGGEMKVRLGITAPLLPEGTGEAAIRLPVFQERNFSIRGQVAHSVWLEGPRPLEGGGPLKAESGAKGLFALRGEIADRDLTGPAGAVRARRSSEAGPWAQARAWSDDAADPDHVICQAVSARRWPKAARAVLVIDGSAGMKGFLDGIAAELERLPAGMEVSVIFAGDEVVELPGAGGAASAGSRGGPAARLREQDCAGGRDNLPALTRAWDIAAERPDGAIVWVHGPQGVELSSVEPLLQRWHRRPAGPRLYDIQVRPGPDRIVERLDGLAAVTSAARTGDAPADLRRLFDLLSGQGEELTFLRQRVARAGFDPAQWGRKTSDHLARLWAAGRVAELLAAAAPGGGEEALRLAMDYHLVTPVSGAVVLETAEQYARAGLEPVPANTVPTVPEPGTLVLLLTGAVALLLPRRERRPV